MAMEWPLAMLMSATVGCSCQLTAGISVDEVFLAYSCYRFEKQLYLVHKVDLFNDLLQVCLPLEGMSSQLKFRAAASGIYSKAV
jgi:hypothetical protein